MKETREIIIMESTTSAASAWFALQTRYRFEERIATELEAKGFESYLPRLKETHQWKDRKKVLDVPAFGGYIFARFDPSLRNRVRVLETAGVVRVLGHHGRPEPVSELEIEALRLALESGVQCERHEHLEVGSKISVRRGPLAGLSGQVMRLGNRVRIFVNVVSVHQSISVEVPLEDIDPLDIPAEQLPVV
ncbi:UpxY family transcription antiterminator [Paracidobacterium acidisoli]|uniref:UpxY family transcription antiterminator n=1 Tax=Paracidobacterium acidisoli TaxID=2303751 RepID=A0A372IR59_9BACT|nr:UpxY family transcription antiterminator [Paracidobacterium acidisoli]MBT9330259.1 UpxY family transcription antiterminator [Paracidobacterium acidisoli]